MVSYNEWEEFKLSNPSHVIKLQTAAQNNIYPSLLYVDSNPIIDLLVEQQNRNGAFVEDYLDSLVQHGGMITWSEHVKIELLKKLHYNTYANYAEQQGIQACTSGRNTIPAWKHAESSVTRETSRRLAKQSAQHVDNIFVALERYGQQADSIDSNELYELACRIYSTYGNSIDDAIHIVYAVMNGTNSILTNDGRFAQVPELNIIGSSHTLLRNTQQLSTELLPDECCNNLLRLNNTPSINK